MRSRGWTITVNYFEEQDLEDIGNLSDYNPSYMIYGFEGVRENSSVHPHIHIYIHFNNARSHQSIMKMFSKQHYIEPVQDPSAMISYCKGYLHGELKEPDIGENDWFEEGIPIQNGVCTSQQKVIMAIEEGLTDRELREKFPSWMLYHEKKVHDYRRNLYLDSDHERKFVSMKLENLSRFLKEHNIDKRSVCFERSSYNGHRVHMVPEQLIEKDSILMLWQDGFSPEIRRGYELIPFNPEYVILYHSE